MQPVHVIIYTLHQAFTETYKAQLIGRAQRYNIYTVTHRMGGRVELTRSAYAEHSHALARSKRSAIAASRIALYTTSLLLISSGFVLVG